MSLYGIEINLPSQVLDDFKFRVNVALFISENEIKAPDGQKLTYTEHTLSFTERPHKQFATDSKEAAEALAETYADSWDAAVVPVGEGREFSAEDLEPVIKRERENAKERLRATRALR